MRKRDQQRFVRRANELIESLGAEETDHHYPWLLATTVGALRLVVREHTVFTRFEEPERAKEKVNCNPHSGKWNHHYFNGWCVDDALADLERRLRRVLP